ncbi:hypothetical protein H2204_004079 [Knufia peltigerae]|uniref:SAP domain-containing protein n=1 Tax=Knufia peltigerae TaxID=1002370 RepID=A0AA38Y7S1_9EURO|nr:hypothetical protein H2204_004079 [Knufia peltigerae]
MGKSRQATPPADWERRPLDGLTIVQLQRILDDNDIEYNRKDKKRVLVNLVKKHCMSGRSKGKDKGKAKAFAHTDALIDETISENDSNMDSAGESGMPGAFQPDQTTNEASGESDDPIALTPTKKHRKEASNVGARDRGKASSKAEQVKKAAGRKEGSKRNRRAEDDGPDSASENNASESSDAETDSEDDETGPPSDTSSDNRRHIDGDDSDESADSEEESDDETNGGTTSGSDSSNDVIESIEQPRMRTLAQIDKAMGNKSSTSLLSGGKIVGWNWIGQNTRVCVEFKIGNVYTGRVKSGRHYDFEKSYETNIAVQTRFLAGKRTRGDARMIKPDIDPKRIGLGTIYWDDLGAKDPISVLHPSKVGEFPWTYIDAKIPGVSGTLKVARRFLPHLLQRPESWVHYFLYKTARQQERRFEQAFKKKKRSSAEVIEISDSEEEVTPRDTRTRRASSAQKRTPSARAHTYNQESDASSEPNGPGRSRKDTPVKRRSREATFDSGYDSPHDDRYLMSGANPAAKKHRSQRSRTSNSSDEDPTPSSNNSERRSKSRSRLSSRDMSTRDESLMEDEEDDQSHRGSRRREESGRRSRSDESGRRGESNSASRSKSTSSRRSRDAQTPEDEDGPEHRSEQPRRNSNKPKSAMKQPRRSRSESSVHFE